MATGILQGLAELHAVNIWHLSLKPAKVLLDSQQHVYLYSYGTVPDFQGIFRACPTVWPETDYTVMSYM